MHDDRNVKNTQLVSTGYQSAAGGHGGGARWMWRQLGWADTANGHRRNVVERCINRLKQWLGLATRYEKRAVNYRAMVVIASIVLWLES